MENNIDLANIIAVRYCGLHELADANLSSLICDIIEQIKYECNGIEEIIDKTIKILNNVLGEENAQ